MVAQYLTSAGHHSLVSLVLPQQTARQMARTARAMTPAMMKGRAEVRRDWSGPVLARAVSWLQLQPSTVQQINLEPEVPLC